MGVGVQTRRKELDVVRLSGWNVPVMGDVFAGKGEWQECLDLSVRIACVCMKQGNELNYNKRRVALSQLANRAASDWMKL